MNNLDPEVAENPDALVVYGGTGRAARSWEAFDAIVRELRRLADDETLLVQSGKPVARVPDPRVGAAGADRELEPRRQVGDLGRLPRARAQGPDDVRPDDRRARGSTSGPRASSRARTRRSPSWRGSTSAGRCAGGSSLTAGLGGMGGAQPLAVTMNDGVCLAIEVDEARARRRLDIGYVDRLTARPGRGARVGARRGRGRARRESIALVGNAAEIEPAWARGRRAVRRRHRPDVGPRRARRLRPGRDLARRRARAARAPSPTSTSGARWRRWPTTSGRCSRSRRAARSSSTTATTSGAQAQRGRRRERLRLPGLRPGVHPAAVLRGPRAVPVGRAQRRPGGHRPDGPRRSSSCSPTTPACAAGSRWPRRRSRSRACRPGSAGSATASGRRPASRSTTSCARGEVAAPIVIGRDHLDAGSVASPNRETEAMADGSDAIADWPLLNALVNTAAGATWVLDPPRRRRRHRLQPARGDGRRRRRHAARGRRSWSAS